MNVAPDQTIILGLQIFLDHRSLSSIDQEILYHLVAKETGNSADVVTKYSVQCHLDLLTY